MAGSFQAVRETLFQPQEFADPWFVDASSQSLPSDSHSISLCGGLLLGPNVRF